MRNWEIPSKSRLPALRRGWRVMLLMTLAFLGTLGPSQTSRDRIEEEEYAVASAALEHFATAFLGGSHVLVINGKTSADDHLQAAVDRIRHPGPKRPKVEDPALTRQVDPEKNEKVKKWLEDVARRRLQDDQAFAGEISDQTILDWTRENYTSSSLSNRFRVSMPVVVLDVERPKKAGRGPLEDFWSAFRKKYPEAGAIVSLSRVGFNLERTQAIIEVGYATGPLGGQGDYVLLGKEDGVWKVHYLLVAWIS